MKEIPQNHSVGPCQLPLMPQVFRPLSQSPNELVNLIYLNPLKLIQINKRSHQRIEDQIKGSSI